MTNPNTNDGSVASGQFLTIDVTDNSRLFECLSALDKDMRGRLSDMLDTVGKALAIPALFNEIRRVLAEKWPDDEAVGVQFVADEYDEGHMFDGWGTVLFADGTTVDMVHFGDEVHEVFQVEYERVSPDDRLIVDLRPGREDITEHDDDSPDLNDLFGIPEPSHESSGSSGEEK